MALKENIESLKVFNVVLPWSYYDDSDGTYSATVVASSPEDAIHKAAVMAMDDQGVDDEDARKEFYLACAELGPNDPDILINEAERDLRFDLNIYFGEFLFPNGWENSRLNLGALEKVLFEHRDVIVVACDEGE